MSSDNISIRNNKSKAMSGKQITSYIIDLAPSMGHQMPSTQEFPGMTGLEVALESVQNQFISKLLKGRKTDYVQAYCSCFDPASNDTIDEVEELDGSSPLQGTAKIVELRSPPKSSDLRRLAKLRAESVSDHKVKGRLWIGILKSLNDIQQFVGKKKFPGKSVVVFTDLNDFRDATMFDLSIEMFAKFQASIADTLEKKQIFLHVCDVGHEDSETRQTLIEGWQSFAEESPEFVKFYSPKQLFQSLSTPVPKTVSPIRTFAGQLRFFNDPIAVLQRSRGEGKEDDDDGDENLSSDSTEMALEVEGFPCIKNDSPIAKAKLAKTVLDEDNISSDQFSKYKIKRFTEYFLFEKRGAEDIAKIKAEKKRRKQLEKSDSQPEPIEVDDEYDLDLYEKKAVDANDLQNSYRYMTSFVPVSSRLEKIRQYQTAPGLDFMGIVDVKSLPRWYLTTESVFLFPKAGSTLRNRVGFATVVKSLMTLGSVIIARFVKKMDQPVQIVALIPVVIDDDQNLKRQADDELKDYVESKKYGFVSSRLPTKEDERGSSFPPLDFLKTKTGEEIKEHDKLLPTKEMKDLMCDYIEAMDLDNPKDIKGFNDVNFSFKPADARRQQVRDAPMTVDEKLVQPRPALHVSNLVVSHIIKQAAKEGISTAEYMKAHQDDYFDRKKLSATEQRFLDVVFQNTGESKNYGDTPTWEKLVKLFGVKYVGKPVVENSDDEIEEIDEDEYNDFKENFNEDESLESLLGIS
ncbi:ATP-dependent DNA helicase [Saccharomycopsis crataegensis]|uniref:DNA helicase n=1 Tax=Saccharomycopsis crataegensis TaxID=43959 RepID=A0AAV5QQ50_9ASCO|nr:ATP-dependent DNA helicase [Saccharomycopsis crataegensis]